MADGNTTRWAYGAGRDPEKIQAKAARYYAKHREAIKAKVAQHRASLFQEEAKARKSKYRKAARARYVRNGFTVNGTPRKQRSTSLRPRPLLWETNARQAWRWWLHNAPDWWVRRYYAALGKPWNNPRLTVAQRSKVHWDACPRYRLYHRLKRWMHKHLKDTSRGSRKWSAVLGYTPLQLHDHLEARFVDGMTWDNMGAWHIDHARPVSSFQFTCVDDPDFAQCYALSNLQPLWAVDNLRKSNRFIDLRVL